MPRSRLVLLPSADDEPVGPRWLAVAGDHARYRLLHVVGEIDDVCRVAPVASALDRAGTFEHIAVDVSPSQGAANALEELGICTTARRLDVSGRSVPRRLGALLEGFDALFGAEAPTAAIIYADDDPSLACALSAAKHHVPVIHVLSGADQATSPQLATNKLLLNRLADLLLAADQEQADGLVRAHVPRHRIHVVGDPLMDLVRRHARRSTILEICRRHGVEPGSYVLVAMTGRAPSLLTGPLRTLAARLPLLIHIDSSAMSASERSGFAGSLRDCAAQIMEPAGFPTRLCLERSAAAIVTDSRRIAERAALLGVPCRLITETHEPADGDAWDIAGLRARRRGSTPRAHSLRDGGAPGRLADAIVANFARVAAAAS